MSSETSSPAVPTDLPRFTVSNYVPDGGFTVGGMMMLISALVICGAGLGFAAHWVSRFFYLILVFPAAIGFVLGAVGIRMIHQGRVRNPWIGGLAGFLGGVLAMSMMHYFDYRDFMDDASKLPPEVKRLGELSVEERSKLLRPNMPIADREKIMLIARVAAVHNMLDYMNFQAEEGVSIKRAASSDKGMNLGYYGSWVYWIIELLIVAGITFAMVQESAGQPYCSRCDQWKSAKAVGTFADPVAATAAVKSGNLNTVRAALPPAPGPVVLTLACCDSCVGQGPVDLKLELVTYDNKKNKNTKRLAHVTYPAEALTPLLQLFAPSAAPPTAAGPAAQA